MAEPSATELNLSLGAASPRRTVTSLFRTLRLLKTKPREMDLWVAASTAETATSIFPTQLSLKIKPLEIILSAGESSNEWGH